MSEATVDKPPVQKSEKPELEKPNTPAMERQPKVGDQVVYHDPYGVDRLALVTVIGNQDGTVNLVAFAAHRGDEAASVEEHIRFAGKAKVTNTWRWPE